MSIEASSKTEYYSHIEEKWQARLTESQTRKYSGNASTSQKNTANGPSYGPKQPWLP